MNKHKTLSDILWEAGLFDEPVADKIFSAVAIEKKEAHLSQLKGLREHISKIPQGEGIPGVIEFLDTEIEKITNQ